MSEAPKNKIELLAIAYASGTTIAAWARANDVVPRTAYRWAKRPGFKRRVAQHRREVVNETLGTVLRAWNSANTALWCLIQPEEHASIRVQAAKAIHAHAMEMLGHVDLADEIEALKAEIAALKAERQGK